ncbi:chitin deacetylase 1-like [Penaeus monodon]|uniref:chitin deacetylase 1-like n=1 Tax=Penaeus monodon TaxID=6687 RepID=UPI0018A732EA|nr:chitin deacetylase 1-like [Penaeus monodon]
MKISSVTLLLLLVGCALAQGVDFVCPKPNGQFASPDSCKIFYSCADNIAYRQRCAEGALYDGHKHECVDQFLDNIACGPQEPTEAPQATTPDPLEALPCDPQDCQLPYCHCSFDGTEIPGGMRAEQVPQIIMLTFDGAINDLNFDTYNQIFLENRTSPNACPIRGTFFVSHDYTNYQLVEEFYSRGHEIALGTVTRRSGLEDGTYEEWVGEMVTMREILSSFAGVRKADMLGMRGPHLKPGKNSQLEVMNDYGFSWDSTQAPTSPVWPSLRSSPHACPERALDKYRDDNLYATWEMPMNSATITNSTVRRTLMPLPTRSSVGRRPMKCPTSRNFQSQVSYFPCIFSRPLRFLSLSFLYHFLLLLLMRVSCFSFRAPYMLALSTNWFQTPTQTNGLLAFIDWTMTLNDVYYTTMTEALQWVTTPQPISELSRFQPWSCQQKVYPDPPCETPNSCQLSLNARHDNYTSAGGSRYMVTCSNCPSVYPWVWDSTGLGRERDIYEPEFRATNIEEPAIL